MMKPKTSENTKKIPNDSNELKRKKVVEKTCQAIKSKFKNLFTDRNFDLAYLKKYIEEIFPSNMDDFNYNVFRIKAEKVILEKLAKIEVKKPCNGVPDIKQVKSLIDIKNEKIKDKHVIVKKEDKQQISLATLEKEKKNDQWAVLAKEEHKKYLNDIKVNKKKATEQKKNLKNMLDEQIKEKMQKETKDAVAAGAQLKARSKSAEKVVKVLGKNEKANKLMEDKINKEFMEIESK